MLASVSVPAALDPNLLVIRQGLHLLAGIEAAIYTRRLPLVYNASIGGHLRHIIEHYHSFLAGLEAGACDYEQRPRHAEIEQDPACASRALADIAHRLGQLVRTAPDQRLAYCTETTPGRHSPTSVVRELEFLLSHTIHHYALVAVMCRLQGHETEPGFGVAPSTLRHEQSLNTCAR